MVKFGVNYDSHIVSRWRDHYLDYESLKKRIAADQKSTTRDSAGGLSEPLLATIEDGDKGNGSIEGIVSRLMEERPNLTFPVAFQDALAKTHAAYFDILKSIEEQAADLPEEAPSKPMSKDAARLLKKQLQSLYRHATQLDSFRGLNHTASIKIWKKFISRVSCSVSKAEVNEVLSEQDLNDGDRIKGVKDRVVQCYLAVVDPDSDSKTAEIQVSRAVSMLYRGNEEYPNLVRVIDPPPT